MVGRAEMTLVVSEDLSGLLGCLNDGTEYLVQSMNSKNEWLYNGCYRPR